MPANEPRRFCPLSLRPFQETEIHHVDRRNDVSFFSPVSNVPKRTTHTRRTDSANNRNQQHGISGNAAATQIERHDAESPQHKRLWQITPTISRPVMSDGRICLRSRHGSAAWFCYLRFERRAVPDRFRNSTLRETVWEALGAAEHNLAAMPS